jgi:hypothetical protein
MDTEQILYKTSRTGTTVNMFSTHLDLFGDVEENNLYPPDNPSNISGIYPSILTFDTLGNANGLYTYNGEYLWSLDDSNDRNINIHISAQTAYYTTGYCCSYVVEGSIDETRRTTLQNRFEQKIDAAALEPNLSCLFFIEREIDDLFVDIKLERTTNILPTLSIQNEAISEFPVQESRTGVLFGRLTARQQIRDEFGNFVLIPLKNVPIGIFNPSDDFPTLTSTDDNGDRITLNLKEASTPDEYFNIESFSADTNSFLNSGSQFNQVPPQYKYVTKTNDNGEFIIHNAPIGPQTVIFEVDLFKQGLTKDEIALNFFPFPANQEPNIDQIPSFFFRQIPVTILPSWGDFQTGYTELNTTVNLDLRKWTTYILPPTSIGGLKTEQAASQNAANTTKVEIRDMTAPDFSDRPVKVAQIFNDLDRDTDHQFLWFDELPSVRRRVDYTQYGCHVLKLPANIYDPNGFSTDKNGIPTNKKGVWLSAYQLKLYASSKEVFRTTGSLRSWDGNSIFQINHFDGNYTATNAASGDDSPESGINSQEFPYEKPWSATYPEPYKIPSRPTKQRLSYGNGRAETSPGSGVYYAIEPVFEDGDLVGFPVNDLVSGGEIAGGFGVQNFDNNWFGNRISYVATKNFMYKYEKGVSWNEEYANGYQQYWDSNSGFPFGGVSQVENGEKFQRLEGGYGYFLRPQGWPRVVYQLWGSDIHIEGTNETNGLLSYGDPDNPGPGTSNNNSTIGPFSMYNYNNPIYYNDVYNLDNQNLALALDSRVGIKKGGLDIYRIIDSGENINNPELLVIPTFIRLNITASDARADRMWIQNSGNSTILFTNSFTAPVFITDSIGGSSLSVVSVNNSVEVEPGQCIYFIDSQFNIGNSTYNGNLEFTGYNLPGNFDFNISTNKYQKAKYTIAVEYNGSVNGNNIKTKVIEFNSEVLTSAPNWYIKTHHNGGAAGRTSNGLNTDFGGEPDQTVDSIRIENDQTSYDQ